MENPKFQIYEEVLVEWLENDWREATVKEIWPDGRYFVQFKDMDILSAISEDRIKSVKQPQNKFFS